MAHSRVRLLDLLLRWLAGLTPVAGKGKVNPFCWDLSFQFLVFLCAGSLLGVPGCVPFAADSTRTCSLTDGVIPQTRSGPSVTELRAHCVGCSVHCVGCSVPEREAVVPGGLTAARKAPRTQECCPQLSPRGGGASLRALFGQLITHSWQLATFMS